MTTVKSTDTKINSKLRIQSIYNSLTTFKSQLCDSRTEAIAKAQDETNVVASLNYAEGIKSLDNVISTLEKNMVWIKDLRVVADAKTPIIEERKDLVIIKTLADFKRAMKVGSLWRFSDSLDSAELNTTRKCVKSQAASFALNNHPDVKDKERPSWIDYPKKADIEFINTYDESTTVRVKGVHFYRYYTPIVGAL